MPLSQAGSRSQEPRRTRRCHALVEALRRHPHLRLRMNCLQAAVCFSSRAIRCLGGVWPGSPPGTKIASIRGSFLKTVRPFLQRELDRSRDRRSPCPAPDTRSTRRAVLVGRCATCSTIISIGGSGKCGLSASSSERGGISSTALQPNTTRSRMYCSHIGTCPGVVGVGLGPIAELMAAQRHLR